MKKKYFSIAFILTILIAVTELLTYFPIPAERITDDVRQMAARMSLRTQTIWFCRKCI